jgi:hypothetical protein
LKLEERRNSAVGVGDLESLSSTLAEDYIHVWGGGDKMDKAGYLAAIAAGPRTHVRDNLKVRLYGDSAVLTGDLLNTIRRPGEDVRVVDAFVTQVAVRQDGEWRFVTWHITPKRSTAG